MAKKKLDNDNSSFDDLDFNFDDEGSGIDQQSKPSKKRGVVSEVATGVLTGVKDTAKSPAFIKDTLKKTLPSSYEDLADGLSEASSSLYELYDHSAKELKPKLGSISRKLDSVVPENNKVLKSLTKKLMDMTGERDEVQYGSQDNQEEQTITSTLSTIFDQQKQYTQIADKKQLLRDTIDKNRFARSSGELEAIRKNTGMVAGYMTSVTQAYQKKSLELQLRSYLVHRQQLTLTTQYFETFKNQYEGILKNTSLPEYKKITMSDRYKDTMKADITRSLYGDKSFLKRGLNKVVNAGKEYVSGIGNTLGDVDGAFGQMLESAKTVEEMNEMMAELGMPPMTKAQFLGSLAGSQGLEWGRDKVAAPIKKRLSKNKKLTEGLAKAAHGVINPAGYIAELRKSDSWNAKIGDYDSAKGKAYRFFDTILDYFGDSAPGKTFSGSGKVGDLNSPAMGFTNKAQLSLTDVIPGHLAAIHREIRIMRTGDESTPLHVYDFERNEFTTAKGMSDKLLNTLKKSVERSASKYAINDAVKDFSDGTVLPPAQEFELKLFMSKLARISNFKATSDNILNTEAYQNLSPAVQDFVKTKLEQMDSSEDKEQNSLNLGKSINKIRRGFPSLEEEMGGMVKAGYGEHLVGTGLVKKTESGDYERDEAAFAKFLETHGIEKKDEISSDINVKQAITKMNPGELLNTVSKRFTPNKFGSKETKTQAKRNTALGKQWNPEQALEGVTKTQLYDWEYKPGKGDRIRHSGPMAQDVNKNLGEETAPRGRKIDLQSMNGALMASIQALDKRIGDKKSESAANEHLARIDVSTRLMLKFAASQDNRLKELIEKTGTLISINTASFDGSGVKSLKDKAVKHLGNAYGSAKRGGKGLLNFLDRTTAALNDTINGRTSNNLSPEDLLNIRAVRQGASLSGLKGALCKKIIEKYPEYKDVDTSDEAIEKARQEASTQEGSTRDYHKSAEERTALANIGQIAINLGGSVLGLGIKGVKAAADIGQSITKHIVKPGIFKAYDMIRLGLSKIEKLTRIKNKYSPDDLLAIRSLVKRAKSRNKAKAEEAKAILDKYPDYLNIDTSDEAIEKARKDQVTGDEVPYTERGILSYIGGITGNAADIFGAVGKWAIGTVLPNAVKRLQSLWGTVSGTASKLFNRVRDLYAEGKNSPVIQAKLLQMGHYKDQLTGKVLETIDDIAACKGNIIDAYGNVVVTVDEIKKGLFDSNGERIKSTLMRGFTGLKNRLIAGASALISGAGGLMGDAGGMIGGNKYLKEGYEVWVDIRDILLGNAKKVRKRLGEKAMAARASASAKNAAGSTGGTTETTTETQTTGSQQAGKGSLFGGLFGKLTGTGEVADKLKDAKATGLGYLNRFKGYFAKKPEQQELMGPTRPSDFMGPQRPEPQELVGPQRPASLTPQEFSGPTRPDDFTGPQRPEAKSKLTQLGDKLHQAKSSKLGGKFLGAGASLRKGALGLFGAAKAALIKKPEQQELMGPTRPSDFIGPMQQTTMKKAAIPQGSRGKGDSDGDGVLDGSVEDRRNKAEALKESRKKAAPAVDLTNRYAGKGGDILDMLSGKLSGLFSLMTSGIGKIFGFAGNLISKLPGVGAIASGAKGVATTAFNAVRAQGLRGAIMTGARLGAQFVARSALVAALPAIGSALVSIGSTALGVIGAVIASPVGIGLLAVGAAYGLYKLYKYATRNNANDYERIRLRQYGLGASSDTDQYNSRMYVLEAYLQDGRIAYTNGKVDTIDRNIKPEELAEIFKIDKEDKELASRFATWYSKRFKPFFLRHMTALYAADPSKKKLDDIPSLSDEAKIKYLESCLFADGPYDETTSPIKGLDTLSNDKTAVAESVAILIKNAQQAISKTGKKAKLPTKDKVAETAAPVGDKAAAMVKAEEAKPAPKPKPADSGLEGAMNYQSDDGPTPDIPKQIQREDVASGAVPLAPGGLTQGSAGMQYLKLGKNVVLDGIDPSTLKLFLGMAEEYGTKTGKTIQVNDGFRSFAMQKALRDKYGPRAAQPGKSLHEFGLALDINSEDANALEEMGLMKKYGFTRPVGKEPWHIEPAGIQKNLALAKTSTSERETMVQASPLRGGGGYGTIASAEQYRRNQSLAMSLLGASGKTVNETIAASTDGKSATLAANDTVGSHPSANDSSYIKTSQSPTDSTVTTLPTNAQLAMKSGEKETPMSGGGESGSTGQSKSDSGNVQDIITSSAKQAGVDPNMLLTFAKMESGMNPNAKAKTSSASGLLGFTKATWTEQLGKNGAKYGLDANASPTDPKAASLMGAEYIKQNMRAMSAYKSDVSMTDVYLSHFLGAGGAAKFLQAPKDAVAADVLPKAAAANAPIFYDKSGKARTIGEIYGILGNKVQKNAPGGGGDTAGPISGASTGSPSGTSSTEASSAPSSMPSAPPPSTGDTSGKEMISPNTSSGVFVDKRGNSMLARERRDAGEQFAGPNFSKIESSLDKSIGLQQDQLSVLRDILENVKTEKVAEVLAGVVASLGNTKASNADTLKEKDQVNMGRRGPTPGSSLDLSRKMM